MANLPIYLDYAATTPIHPDVAALMSECLTIDGNFGNPASRSHLYGWKAEELVEKSRKQLADLLNADTREIVWTSGASESNNLALKGVLEAIRQKQNSPNIHDFCGLHIITSSIEHKSILDTAAFLEKLGAEITYLKPDENGRVAFSAVQKSVKNNTALVSVMHANNEIGVINPIAEIGAFCREEGILFHTDAAQTSGKLLIDTKALQADLISISAHKMYGPKGIGALFVRRHPDVSVSAQIHGGGHERGMRSGTLATHQIAGFGKAAEIAEKDLDDDHTRNMRDRFWESVKGLRHVSLNGDFENRLPNNLNLAFEVTDGETLLMSLHKLAISSGSACMSATISPSYVLTEMGYSEERAQNSLRFSFGRFTTASDVDTAVEHLKAALTHLDRASA